MSHNAAMPHVLHTASNLSGHPPPCPRYPQVFEHPWCKSAADDKRELLKVGRGKLGGMGGMG